MSKMSIDHSSRKSAPGLKKMSRSAGNGLQSAGNARQPSGMRVISWSVALACAGLSANIHATDLAEVPLAVLNVVPPNVYITLDRSGSMQSLLTENTRMYNRGYNNTVRYRPWLYDGITPAPRGPVRFEEVDMDSAQGVCNQYDWTRATASVVWANGYVTGSGTNPDYIRAGCNGRGNRNQLYVTSSSFYNYDPNATALTAAELAVILSGRPTGTPPSGRTDCSPSGCTEAQERVNLSNYWQYHRNRYLAARAAIGEALGRQKKNARAGFAHFSSDNPAGSRYLVRSPIYLLNPYNAAGNIAGAGSTRYQFFQNVYSNVDAYNGTPTRPALIGVGEYFKTDEPYLDDPRLASSPMRSCRANYNILMTDGNWNTGSDPLYATIGNADGGAGVPYADANGNVTTGSENAGPTLADIASYYYNTDLRTDLINNVPVSTKDPASHQHLVTYAVAMGLSGSIPRATINSIFSWMGTDPATRGAPPGVAWPNPLPSEDNTRIDDLAHAGVNSHGGYFVANNPQDLTRAIMAALNDATGRSTSAPVAVSNPVLSATGDNIAYITGYDAGDWSGELQAYSINPATAAVEFTGSAPHGPQWSTTADVQLNNRTPSDRVIVTWKGRNTLGSQANAIPFLPDEMLADGRQLKDLFHLNALTPGGAVNDGARLINYLRGDKSNEGLDDLNYRERPRTVLGDIVASGPVLIGAPRMKYQEGGDGLDVGYPQFITDNESRQPAVAVGANDGMLHVFDARTGRESWAYIPSFAYDCSLSGPDCQPVASGNAANPLRDMAMPFGFQHHYFVNGPSQDTDIDFNKTGSLNGPPDWRTILVGSLGRGGRGVYALDMTTPLATSVADAQSKVLWEFPYRKDGSGDAIPEAVNMGYSFGQIHTGKVVINGKQRWVSFVPSGYNNGAQTGGDGKGHLFILDARTGELIQDIVAGASDPLAGDANNPAGLAHISAQSKDQLSNHASNLVYGADLLGNLWRFDLTSDNPNNWHANRIARLLDANGNPQPVTTAPTEVRIDDDKLWVLVGTGRYLDTTDRPQAPNNTAAQNLAAGQTQSFYVIKDPFQDGGGATISNLRSVLARYTLSTAGTIGANRVATLSGSAPSDSIGWYVDLGRYERVTLDPLVGLSSAIVAVNAPSDDACSIRGNGSMLVLPLIDFGASKTSITAGYSFGQTTVMALTIVQTSDGAVKAIGAVDRALTDAECATLKANQPNAICTGGLPIMTYDVPGDTPPPAAPRRVYWRDLPTE